jgi:periplasmic divalent cation tolerance protein
MIVVLSAYPDIAGARKAARGIVEKKLAACASIVPAVESHYRWKGRLQKRSECLLIIKTSKAAYPKLEAFIRKNHPYEVPEIIWMDAKGGLKDYLAWVQTNSG